MSPGEIGLLLGSVPYGILAGTIFQCPLCGSVFYLVYVLLSLEGMRTYRSGLGPYLVSSLLALVATVTAKLLL